MKQALNFRLNEQTVATLSVLQKKLHCSKTEVVEKAIEAYLKKELPRHKKILAFAGVLNNDEATLMLEAIKTAKNNKDMDFEL